MDVTYLELVLEVRSGSAQRHLGHAAAAGTLCCNHPRLEHLEVGRTVVGASEG
jgi:hypothetical protein